MKRTPPPAAIAADKAGSRECEWCESPLKSRRPDAKYCSGTCRGHASTSRKLDALQKSLMEAAGAASRCAAALHTMVEHTQRAVEAVGRMKPSKPRDKDIPV